MSGLCGGAAPEAFALVAYLPEPLAGFVNRVRRELSPGCSHRAHITILPPRQLACGRTIASRELQPYLSHARAFRVELGSIGVFRISEVVYLSIGAGLRELHQLHQCLNQGRCLASEVWDYEPHVTLAQDLDSSDIDRARDLAGLRWREYTGPREFLLDRATFVQGSPERGWVDLESFELLSPVLA